MKQLPRALCAVYGPTRKIKINKSAVFTGIVISQIKGARTPCCLLPFHLSDNKSSAKCNKKEEMQD